MNETTSKLEEGNKKVEDSLVDIEKMASQMTEIKDKIDEVFSDIDKQSEFTSDFAKQVSNISDSYEELSKDCKEQVHMYTRLDVILIRQEVIWFEALLRLQSGLAQNI